MAKNKISLTIYDRINLRAIILDKRDNVGGLDNVRLVFNVLNKIDFTDDENEEFGIRVEGTSVVWNEGGDKDFELTNKELDIIKDFIREKTNWTLDVRNIDFAEKFGIKLFDDDDDDEDVE